MASMSTWVKTRTNVVVSVDGRIALTSDNGNNGASDGLPDTVSVIDLEANPPVVINQIQVGVTCSRGTGGEPGRKISPPWAS